MPPTENTVPTPAPPRAALEVHESTVGDDTCVIAISGELDLAGAPRLKASLQGSAAAMHTSGIVLDLSELTYLDSTGLAVLIAFRRRLVAGRRLVLANPTDQVIRLLTLTGLISTFDTFASVPDAVEYLEHTSQPQNELPLSPDAALVLGLAATALPFTDSLAAEASCWQRILLSGGGVGDVDLPSPEVDAAEGGVAAAHMQRLDRVLAHAASFARERGAAAIRTGDVLRGVVCVYGDLVEHVG